MHVYFDKLRLLHFLKYGPFTNFMNMWQYTTQDNLKYFFLLYLLTWFHFNSIFYFGKEKRGPATHGNKSCETRQRTERTTSTPTRNTPHNRAPSLATSHRGCLRSLMPLYSSIHTDYSEGWPRPRKPWGSWWSRCWPRLRGGAPNPSSCKCCKISSWLQTGTTSPCCTSHITVCWQNYSTVLLYV